VGRVADVVTHHLQGFTEHDKGIWIQSTDQPFEPAQFLEGDDRVQNALILAGISSLPLKNGHAPVEFLNDFLRELPPLRRDDPDRFSLTQPRDDQVDHVGTDVKRDETPPGSTHGYTENY
jgi:hypothetical protein